MREFLKSSRSSLDIFCQHWGKQKNLVHCYKVLVSSESPEDSYTVTDLPAPPSITAIYTFTRLFFGIEVTCQCSGHAVKFWGYSIFQTGYHNSSSSVASVPETRDTWHILELRSTSLFWIVWFLSFFFLSLPVLKLICFLIKQCDRNVCFSYYKDRYSIIKPNMYSEMSMFLINLFKLVTPAKLR